MGFQGELGCGFGQGFGFGLLAGGFSAGTAGADGDLGGVEELRGLGWLEDLKDESVGDAGDEGVDGVWAGGQVGHGVAVGDADPAPAFIAEAGVFGVFTVAGLVVGFDATLDGGFGGGGHG